MKNFKGGLKPHKHSSRDFSHNKSIVKRLGAFDLSTLPKEYLLISPILIQNGYKCTAYASSAIQESQHGIPFDPEWYYQQEGIVAKEVSDTGYDLRTNMQTGVDKGFRPLSTGEPADKYKEGSYFYIDGDFDLFDNIRVAMWLAQAEKKCANLGTTWYDNWSNETIITTGENPVGGHDIKCAGWKEINGVPYLAIQNSYGTNIGDKGIQYFPREIVNKEFKIFGAYLWRQTIDKENIVRIGLLQNWLNILVQWLNLLMKKQEQNRQVLQPVPQPAPTTPPNVIIAPPQPVYPQAWLDFPKDDDPLIQALIMKESQGQDDRIGDLQEVNKAYGPLQIRLGYITDVNHAYDTNFKPQDCLNNRQLSIYVCKAYFKLWANKEHLGRESTWEDKARIHNAGPQGWKNEEDYKVLTPKDKNRVFLAKLYWSDLIKYYLKTN